MSEIRKSIESEKHLIGIALLSRHIPAGAREVTPTDFVTPQYKATWRAFQELDEAHQELDHISAHEIVKRTEPTLATWFTASELVNTTVGMVHGINERVFVKAIKEAALRRHIAAELQEQIKSLDIEDGETTITSLRRMIDGLGSTASTQGHFVKLADILEHEVKPALYDLEKGQTSKISTGWDAIDRMIGGGLSLTDILLVAGLPGSGKSALVLQMAVNIAKQGVPVAFLSGEMSNKENALRLLSQAAGFANLNSQVHLTQTERTELVEWADALKTIPIYFDSRTYDLQSVSKAMRSMVEHHQVKVLVIDYIQLLKVSKSDKQSRYERITEVSQEVKRIAMEYGVAVIEVAQFNREGAKSGKPKMHDLEGSSQLEKDTSLIFIIDRDAGTANVAIRIEKGRNSGLGEIPGRFAGYKLTFEF